MEQMQQEYDDELISLVVVDEAPTTTIAERMHVTPQAVSYRRRMALKRRGAPALRT